MCETIVLAHTAYKTHRKTTFAQRRRLLRCFKSWLLKDLQTVVRVGARDTGKTGGFIRVLELKLDTRLILMRFKRRGRCVLGRNLDDFFQNRLYAQTWGKGFETGEESWEFTIGT